MPRQALKALRQDSIVVQGPKWARAIQGWRTSTIGIQLLVLVSLSKDPLGPLVSHVPSCIDIHTHVLHAVPMHQ